MISRISKPALIAVAGLLTACMLLASPGCRDGAVSREKLEKIDAALRSGTCRMAGTTSFIGAMKVFDFENASFYGDVMQELDSGRDAARAVLESVEEMSTFDYRGGLSALGGYVEEYTVAVVEAVEELDTIYEGIKDIFQAIEPVLREEAVITQLEAPGSDADLLERLGRLDAALDLSLEELPGIVVPSLLGEYKSLFEGIFTTLQKLVQELIAAATGGITDEEMENNPDFEHMQGLLADYVPLVEALHERLRITSVEPLLEKVELEINRLYLELSGQQG